SLLLFVVVWPHLGVRLLFLSSTLTSATIFGDSLLAAFKLLPAMSRRRLYLTTPGDADYLLPSADELRKDGRGVRERWSAPQAPMGCASAARHPPALAWDFPSTSWSRSAARLSSRSTHAGVSASGGARLKHLRDVRPLPGTHPRPRGPPTSTVVEDPAAQRPRMSLQACTRGLCVAAPWSWSRSLGNKMLASPALVNVCVLELSRSESWRLDLRRDLATAGWVEGCPQAVGARLKHPHTGYTTPTPRTPTPSTPSTSTKQPQVQDQVCGAVRRLWAHAGEPRYPAAWYGKAWSERGACGSAARILTGTRDINLGSALAGATRFLPPVPMNLYVSCGSILNTVLRDDSGQPRYRIETSTILGLKDEETTISRFLPGTSASGARGLREEEIARIEWHRIRSTMFERPGQNPVEVDVKRAFTATNGQSYTWKSGRKRSSLSRNDSYSSRIAQYHKRSYGILGKAHSPYLEIFPAGLSITDEIVVTFIYVEWRRDQREKARRNHA
ncbi:hypothetical protein EVG20_g10011, partial [Dentipellis fragilis]